MNLLFPDSLRRRGRQPSKAYYYCRMNNSFAYIIIDITIIS